MDPASIHEAVMQRMKEEEANESGEGEEAEESGEHTFFETKLSRATDYETKFAERHNDVWQV